MKKFKTFIQFGLCAGVATFQLMATAADTNAWPKVDPAALQTWQSNRFGMFIHFGPCSLTGGELSWSRMGERRDRHETPKDGTPAAEYDELYHRFNPSNFNAHTWVEIAKTTGMKYMVLTAKHHDGFVMFDSKLTDYKITKTPYGRDFSAEFAQACHEAGVGLGFYYSPPDWHHPDFMTNPAKYNEYFHGQVRELLSNYGRVDELWFDTDGGDNTPELWDNKDLFPMIRTLQPQILVTKRCGDWGDFDTPEQRVGKFQNDEPWETCMTLCTQWSWKPNDTMKPLAECLRTLALCAGGDGNLLLNVGPMPDGQIEPRQVERLKEIGAWLDQNGESIYGTRGGPWRPGKFFSSTRKGNVIYLHLLKGGRDSVELPDIKSQIRHATLLNGRKVKVSKHHGKLLVTVASAARDANDTVVKLELDGSAMDLPVLESVERTKVAATASGVFQNDFKEYGPQAAFDNDEDSRWATDIGTKQAWVAADFGQPRKFQRVMISEAYAGRVRRFEFQYRDGGEWKTLFTGTTLGERFEKQFKPVKASEFRLNILDANDAPTINEIELK